MNHTTRNLKALGLLTAAALFAGAATASAATYNWSTGSGTWDASTGNWSGAGSTWVNGNDAIFSNTAAATTITLTSGLTAGAVKVGDGGNNANYTFTNGTGGSLTATSFTVQGAGGNDPGTSGYPVTTLNNASLTVNGDLGVGRASLVIGDNTTVIADRIGGAGMTGITSADWGQVTINTGANVTAKNGIVGGTTAWGLNLNGGILATTGINYGPHAWSSSTINLKFNGTLVKVYDGTQADNVDFITTSGGLDFAPVVQAGGAKFDTNNRNITISVGLAHDAATLGAGLDGGLTKSGNGTLTLSGAANTFNGGVTVDGGTLLLNKAVDVDCIAAGNAVVVNSGGTLKLGANRGQINDSIASLTLNNGGTFDLVGHIEGINPAVTMNNGTITGTSAGFLLARGGYVGTGTNTISQRLSTRAGDANSGKFDITSGTTTVSGAIYTDWGAASGITKSGAGTLVLSGNNGYTGATTVNAGILKIDTAGMLAAGSAVTVGDGVNPAVLINNGTIGGTVTVASGATLKGNGTISGLTTVNGTHSPGNSPDLQTLDSVTYNSTAVFDWQLYGNTDETVSLFDRVTGTGLLTIDSAAKFNITLNDSASPTSTVNFTDAFWNSSQIWNVFTGYSNLGSAGMFTIGTVTTDVGGRSYNSYGAFSFSNGNLIWTPSAIPEPGTLGLLAFGALALLGRRRSRNR